MASENLRHKHFQKGKYYIFPAPNDPWFETFSEYIDFPNTANTGFEANFIGIKIGDINGDADTTLLFQDHMNTR